MPDLKVEILEQHHPEYDREQLNRYRALYEGGKPWRRLVEHWVPQNAKEASDVYEDRKKRAFYGGDVGAMVDLVAAYLFSEAVQVEGLDGEFYTRLLQDVDGAGTKWQDWWKERFLDALVGKRAWVWVDPPARPNGLMPQSRADEEAAGLLDVRLVGPIPEQVVDWEVDERGRLLWVLVHGVTERRLTVDGKRSRVHRWTWIDATVIRRWEWEGKEDKPDPTPDDQAHELEPITHNMGRIPVVRLELPAGLWALNKLYDLAVALTRRENDLDWSLHRAAHALMAIHSKWGDEDPILGPGYYLKLGIEDRVEYAEPSGVSFEAQASHAKELRAALYRVLHQMAASVESDASRTRTSGESKARDWQALEIVLSAYGDLLLKAMRQTLEVVAAARGESSEALSVKGLDGWQLEDLESFLQGALLGQGLVKSETYQREVAKRVTTRLLQDEVAPETIEVIHSEIDQADYSGDDAFVPAGQRKNQPREDDAEPQE